MEKADNKWRKCLKKIRRVRGEGTRERDEESLDTVLLVMKKVLQRKTFCNFATIVFQIVVHHHHRETCPCVVRLWTYHLGLLMVLDESSRKNLIVKCFWKTSQIWHVFFDDWNHDRSSDVIKKRDSRVKTPVEFQDWTTSTNESSDMNLRRYFCQMIRDSIQVRVEYRRYILYIYIYIYIYMYIKFFFHEHC